MCYSLAATAAVSVAFVLVGLKSTNQSRHDVYEDGVFFYVWFQAKAFPDIVLDSEASTTSDMGVINNAAVCRNSDPVCYMRFCMIFSSFSFQRNAVRIVAATLYIFTLLIIEKSTKQNRKR